MTQLRFGDGEPWIEVPRVHEGARRLADRHYSRQTIGARDFMPPGQTFVLVTADAGAVWGVCLNLDPVGSLRWRVTIFRRESGLQASELVRSATDRTLARWRERGALPRVPLSTEIDPRRVRRKRDPGRCFRRAGWELVGERRGLLVLVAPGELERCGGSGLTRAPRSA